MYRVLSSHWFYSVPAHTWAPVRAQNKEVMSGLLATFSPFLDSGYPTSLTALCVLGGDRLDPAGIFHTHTKSTL